MIKRMTPALLIASVILAGAVVLFRSAESVAFHGDESGWIASGIYYSDLVLDRDFTWEKWRCPACSNWGSLNPQVGKLMIGIPLKMYSYAYPEREDDFHGYYDFDYSVEENVAQGRVPSTKTLIRARRASAVLGVLCCLLIFGIGYLSDSAWTAVFAVGLLLMNPLFVESASRAMTDIHYSTFLLLLCVVSIFILKARHPKHVRSVSAICGILAGLSCSVKVTGIVIGGCYFLLITTYKYFIGGMGKPWLISAVAVFTVSAVLTIYASNPYYWPSAADLNVKELVAEVRAVPAALSSTSMQAQGEHHSPQHLSRLLAFPVLFIRWQRLMTTQESRPSAAWNGNRSIVLQKQLFWNNVSFRWELCFFLIGVLVCVGKIWNSRRERRIHPLAAPLIYFGVNYLFILIFLKLNWVRYYLPTIIASRVLVAVGIVQVVRLGTQTLSRVSIVRTVRSGLRN